ncbi:hypothetical protein Pcinc_027181 [Petrolisthes cinctipes]|uniref:Uncharacterized protein n=1 Tax=Petrolisthes cinctipes TaxID=88211 RepID=A0AAE1K900_PETCI|nr:hypothetical protein Pcinc_027181 [Petrolisthes cinctipes]
MWKAEEKYIKLNNLLRTGRKQVGKDGEDGTGGKEQCSEGVEVEGRESLPPLALSSVPLLSLPPLPPLLPPLSPVPILCPPLLHPSSPLPPSFRPVPCLPTLARHHSPSPLALLCPLLCPPPLPSSFALSSAPLLCPPPLPSSSARLTCVMRLKVDLTTPVHSLASFLI